MDCNHQRKKALLLCTSHNDLGSILALRKMGYTIIATGNREGSSGEKMVDKWIYADYSEPDLIMDIMQREGIQTLIPCCNDYGVYTSAYVAEKLGLPGYDSYETTLILHNKDKFKSFAKENGIPTPRSEMASNANDARVIADSMGVPVIIKPVDSSAGNGISIARETSDLDDSIYYAFKKSRAGRIVIEKLATGTQHGFCTFLHNQKVVAYCSNNEYSILNPFRVEIDTFPADHTEVAAPILIQHIETMAKGLSLKDGIFHLQYMYDEGKVQILEVMRRTIGNMYHVLSNPLTGLNWEYWETRARAGLSCDDIPKNTYQEGCYAYKTILATENGVIQDVCLPEEYDKYTFKRFMLLGKDDEVTDYKSTPIGFLFMIFPDSFTMKRVLIDEYRCDFVKMK